MEFAEVTMRRLIAAAAFALFAFVLLPEASPDVFGPKEIGPRPGSLPTSTYDPG